MEKFKVVFADGESRYTNDSQGVDYMQCYVVDENGDDIELYAEVDVKSSPFELDFGEASTPEEMEAVWATFDPEAFSSYSYPLLKQEIVRQAIENGINPEILEFFE